jgi:hypothetical protein
MTCELKFAKSLGFDAAFQQHTYSFRFLDETRRQGTIVVEAKVVLWCCNKSVSVVRSQGRFASVCERHDDNAEKVGGGGVRGVGCAARLQEWEGGGIRSIATGGWVGDGGRGAGGGRHQRQREGAAAAADQALQLRTKSSHPLHERAQPPCIHASCKNTTGHL